jgi:hypothetical protein
MFPGIDPLGTRALISFDCRRGTLRSRLSYRAGSGSVPCSAFGVDEQRRGIGMQSLINRRPSEPPNLPLVREPIDVGESTFVVLQSTCYPNR